MSAYIPLVKKHIKQFILALQKNIVAVCNYVMCIQNKFQEEYCYIACYIACEIYTHDPVHSHVGVM